MAKHAWNAIESGQEKNIEEVQKKSVPKQLINSFNNRNMFAEDVLAKLQSRRVTFRKCQPNYVSLKADGSVEVHFTGYRDHKPWQGVVKFNCPFPPDKIMLADPAVVADICEQGVHLMDAT